MFDKDLFLSLCKKYGVKMSSEYGQPMIEHRSSCRYGNSSDVPFSSQKGYTDPR